MNRAERRRSKDRNGRNTASALEMAIRRHRAGDLVAAEAAYVARLRTCADDPDALHYLGVLRHQQQRSDEAIMLITQALDRAPAYIDAWNNLGNVL